MNLSANDKALGLGRPIARRDFLNGVAIAIGAIGGSGLGIRQAVAQSKAWLGRRIGQATTRPS